MRLLHTVATMLLLCPLVYAQAVHAQAAPAQVIHTTDAPTVIEGPQTPGVAPPPPPKPASSTPLNNENVLRMFHAGLGEDLILQSIASIPGAYDVSPDTLISLKQAGLSDPILKAMISANRRPLTPRAAASVDISPVNEPGVYYKNRDGQWILMDSEIVHVVSGGFLKSTLTHNIIKEDRNGRVDGRESKLLLQRPIQFLIYTPDGVTGSEYDLILFRLNGSSREFRTLTGGVIHSTGGATRDEVPFKPVMTAPHTYVFTLDEKIPGGEYGILPPGTGNVTNGGKIYTFAITVE